MNDQSLKEPLDRQPFFDFRRKAKRKYLAEAGLNLFSRQPVLLRPADVHRFGKNPQLRALLEGSNVYLICRRRRITFDPHDLELSGGVLRGRLLAMSDRYAEWESTPFSLDCPTVDLDGQPLGFRAMRPLDTFGHEIEVIDGLGRQVTIPSCAAVASGKHSLGDRTKLEVLYVGQTWGATGQRIALDRLSEHTTLQRILAESAEEFGLSEILILAYQYGNARNILSTGSSSWVEPDATSTEEQAHIVTAGRQEFQRRDRILLAEAALINYFKPKYNIQHLDSFSTDERRKKLATLRSLFASDFTALIVEISSSNVAAKLWTPTVQRTLVAQFFDEERLSNLRRDAALPGAPVSSQEVEEWERDLTHTHITKVAIYDASQRESFIGGLGWS